MTDNHHQASERLCQMAEFNAVKHVSWAERPVERRFGIDVVC